MTAVLSVDLACKRYSDIGVVLLERQRRAIHAMRICPFSGDNIQHFRLRQTYDARMDAAARVEWKRAPGAIGPRIISDGGMAVAKAETWRDGFIVNPL